MNINHNFSRLTLISSAGCNLSCKYCIIAQNKTSLKYSDQMQKEIIQAFQDGSFLKHTQEIYNFFNQDPSIVREIDLWGQEPTLTLPYLTEHIDDWLKAYPKCEKMFFSTNFGTNPMILFNFIEKLNEILIKPFTLKIQISYDGIYSCEHERGIDPNLIKQNYLLLINKINNLVLNNLTIHFSLHGVINFETIYALINDDNQLIEFIKDLDETQVLFESNIHNGNCKFVGNSLVVEQPYDASKKDGQIISLFLQKINILADNLSLHFLSPTDNFLRQFSNRSQYSSSEWLMQINNQLNLSYNPFNTNLLDKKLTKALSCGIYDIELKITYNGIILDCLNNMFNLKEELLNSTNPIDYNIFNTLIEHNYYINPLKDSENDIKTIFNIYDNFETSFLTLYQSVINLIILLADVNQVHNSYKYNKDKLLRHAYYITCFQYCPYNRLLKSSSHYLSNTGICRLLCNGLLDLVDEYNLKQEKK